MLVATNLSLFTFLSSLVIDHYQSNYNLLSFGTAFHVLTLLWLVIRGLFWILTVVGTTEMSTWLFYALYWMPVPIEFGSFMLLPLFFSQVLYPEWKKHWGCIRFVYISSICALILFQALWIVLTALEMQRETICGKTEEGKSEHCFHTEFSSDAFRVISACCFLFLAAAQGSYGYQLTFLDPRLHERYLISSPKILAAVNTILVVSFLSRGVYQLITLFKVFFLPDIPLQGTDDVSIWTLLFFMVWDYVPTVLLVVTVTSKVMGNNNRRRISYQTNAWEWTTATTTSLSTRIAFPEYGVFRQLEDDEVVTSVASSFQSHGSSSNNDTRPQTATWIITQSAPVDILSLKR